MPTTPRSYGQMVAVLVLIVVSALAGALLLTRAGDMSSVKRGDVESSGSARRVVTIIAPETDSAPLMFMLIGSVALANWPVL